jgi:hypothetical protein
MSDWAGINTDDLEGECARLPGRVAYVGTQYALAERLASEHKLALKVEEGRLYNQMRAVLEATKGKTTEKAVDHAVVTSDSYQDHVRRLADAEQQAQELRSLLEALRTKRDMLVSIGAGRRAEAAGGLPVR